MKSKTVTLSLTLDKEKFTVACTDIFRSFPGPGMQMKLPTEFIQVLTNLMGPSGKFQ